MKKYFELENIILNDIFELGKKNKELRKRIDECEKFDFYQSQRLSLQEIKNRYLINLLQTNLYEAKSSFFEKRDFSIINNYKN